MPSGLTAVAGFKQARLSWQPSTPGTHPISHYEVTELGRSEVVCETRATRCTAELAVTDGGLGWASWFAVAAVDIEGYYSSLSNEVAVLSQSSPARPASITLRVGTVPVLHHGSEHVCQFVGAIQVCGPRPFVRDTGHTFEGLIASWSAARQTDLPVEGYRVTLYRDGVDDGGCDVFAHILECGLYPNGPDSAYRACVQAMDTSHTYSAERCSQTVTLRDGVALTFQRFDDPGASTRSEPDERAERCPDGWRDTSVGRLRFCSHPEHGSRTLRDAWQMAAHGPT